MSWVKREVSSWRYEWFPLMAAVVVLAVDITDLRRSVAAIIGLLGLFVLARAARRSQRKAE